MFVKTKLSYRAFSGKLQEKLKDSCALTAILEPIFKSI